MPRVTDEHRANRRAQMVPAAVRCFERQGFHATSVADIVAESGLSAGSVYQYVRSKDEIIAAVSEAALAGADRLGLGGGTAQSGGRYRP